MLFVFDASYMKEIFGGVCENGRFGCIAEITKDGTMKG